MRYVLDAADLPAAAAQAGVHGPDFPGETFRVLKEKEQPRFGEYRTRRLVLEEWDKQERESVRRGEAGPVLNLAGRSAV